MNAETGFQFDDLRGLVRRRAPVAAFTALTVTLVAYWIAMALPNVYQSYATVLVEPQAVDEQLVRAGVQSSDLNERLHLMTAQILSRARLSRIIEQYDLYQEESEYLLRESLIDLMRSRITVEPVVPDLERAQAGRRESEINEFRIKFSDYDAEVARNVAQQLANDFIQTHIEARVQVSQKSMDFIQSELERLADRIANVESRIAAVKNEHPGSLPEDLSANQRRMERILTDLAVAQRANAEATSDLGFYESQVATAQIMGGPNDEASPARKLELLKLQLAEYKSRGFTEKHPDIITTKAEIEEVEASIARAGAGEDEGPPSLLEQQAEAQVSRARLRVEATEEEIQRLQAMAEEVQARIQGTPAVAEKLDALNREYEHLFASFQDFSQRLQEATVQAQLERRQLGEQFRVLEAAFIAPDPSAPNRPLILMLGIFFGLALGGGVAIVLEAADTTAHDPRRLQSSFGLPVLAAIPEIWLEADRARLRRKRMRTLAATAAVVLFVLVGGAVNYMWVNGAPGFLSGGGEQTQPVAAQGAEG